MKRVLLTGSSGQLGAALLEKFSDAQMLATISHRELDLTDEAAVRREALAAHPKAILNCASWNDVDGAEERPLEALRANAFAVRALARAADAAGAVFVHFGTDFVFDGEKTSPYAEDDVPRPRSVYGASKLLGEHFALDARRPYVLRVESLFGGPRPKSTLDRLVATLARGEKVRAFSDRVVSPSFVEDVATATRAILELRLPHGIYHCVSSGAATWLELARAAERLLGREGLVEPVSMNDVPLRAFRPRYCALSNAKLAAAGIVMPDWQNALERSLRGREEER